MPIFKRKKPVRKPVDRPTAEELQRMRDAPVGKQMPNPEVVTEQQPDQYMRDVHPDMRDTPLPTELPRPPQVPTPMPTPEPEPIPEPVAEPTPPVDEEAEVVDVFHQYVDAIELRLSETQVLMKRLKELVRGVK